jgi:ribonucleoside-diphosphate reductase alpha chain
VFDCAFTPAGGTRSIPWKAHIAMMAAAQPFLSGAISKTVNMPRDSTPQDIAEAYFDGWKLGLKALAIYRDGSKDSQPLNTKRSTDKADEATLAKPRRERLPDTRDSKTHKFSVAGHEGYITVGLYPDGRPGELFITMAKEGSTIGGLMDAFGTSVSMSLQYGVPLEDYVRKFSHMRFEPQGHTKNPDIRIAKSLIDYIFRWLGITFLPGYREASLGEATDGGGKLASKPADDPAATKPSGFNAGTKNAGAKSTGTTPADKKGTNGHHPSNGKSSPLDDLETRLLERAGAMMSDEPEVHTSRSEQFAGFQTDAPSCDNCGAITVRNGNCYLCHNCGNSMGCS